MPIIKNGDTLKVFKGDYHPVNVYKGNNKLTGWHNQYIAGQSIDFNNTYNDSADVVLSGNSVQVQTVQGKNIIDSKLLRAASKYNLPSWYSGAYTAIAIPIPNGIYTFSTIWGVGYKAIWETYSTCVISVTTSVNSGSFFTGMFAHSTDYPTNINRTFPLTVTNGFVYFSVYGATDAILTDFYNNVQIQLESGSVATPYAPFVPNSPSPDYPSPINSAGNCNLISRGKNLVDVSEININNYGIDSIENGTIRMRGQWWYIDIGMNLYPVEAGKTYTLSFYQETLVGVGGRFGTILWIGKDIEYLGEQSNEYVTTSGWRYVTATAPTGTKYAVLRFARGGFLEYVEANVSKIQFEEGPVKTAYEPFRGYSSMPITVPLRSLPNSVADTYKKTTGEYKKRVGEFVVNENIALWVYNYGGIDLDTYTYHAYTWSIPNIKREGAAISDRFANTGNYSFNVLDVDILTTYYATSGDLFYFQLRRSLIDPYDGATPYDKVISFFKTNPITILYELKESVTQYLAPGLVPTYYPFTHLETDGAVKADIEATVKVRDE